MRTRYIIWGAVLAGLVISLILSVRIALLTGEIAINLKDIPKILDDTSSLEYGVLFNLRLPRIILGFSIGGALSLTGAILQGVYRNPLVEPYTLGISGGAALGVALGIVFELNQLLGSYILPLLGFAGALSTIFLVYVLSMRKGDININRMLLIGVMISFVASSMMMFIMAISTSENLHSIIFWIMGSLEEPNSLLINIMLIASVAGLLFSYIFVRPLNALRLGESKARHLGINSALTIRLLFIIASILTGMCVAVGGIIGFVGLIIPHFIRIFVGSDYRILLIASFLGGATFLIDCDVIARTVIAPNELPIGVITGFLGGLVFILVLSFSKAKFKLGS